MGIPSYGQCSRSAPRRTTGWTCACGCCAHTSHPRRATSQPARCGPHLGQHAAALLAIGVHGAPLGGAAAAAAAAGGGGGGGWGRGEQHYPSTPTPEGKGSTAIGDRRRYGYEHHARRRSGGGGGGSCGGGGGCAGWQEAIDHWLGWLGRRRRAAAARGCACCTRASSTPCSLSCGRPARRLLSSWSRWRASSTTGGRRNGRARSAHRCTRRWRWRRRAALGRGAGGPHFRSASLPPGRSHRVLAAVSGLAAPAGPLERGAVGVSGARSGDGAQMPPGHRGRRSPRRAFNASLDGAAYSAAWAGGRCPAHRRCSASAVAASLQHWSASVKVGVRVAVRRG